MTTVYGSRQIFAEGIFDLDAKLNDFARRYPEERLIALTLMPGEAPRRWIATWVKTIDNE
jgi:hypothetical protein